MSCPCAIGSWTVIGLDKKCGWGQRAMSSLLLDNAFGLSMPIWCRGYFGLSWAGSTFLEALSTLGLTQGG